MPHHAGRDAATSHSGTPRSRQALLANAMPGDGINSAGLGAIEATDASWLLFL